jgi:hypothetical protein
VERGLLDSSQNSLKVSRLILAVSLVEGRGTRFK